MWAWYRRAFNNHVYKRQHERQIPDGRSARQASWKHADTTRAPVPCCVILFCVNVQPDCPPPSPPQTARPPSYSPMLLFLLLSMSMQHQIQVTEKNNNTFSASKYTIPPPPLLALQTALSGFDHPGIFCILFMRNEKEVGSNQTFSCNDGK